MTEQKDRHLEAPSEANRDKHINFLAEENGDVDPADENYNKDSAGDDSEKDVDNGFFTDEGNKLQTREEYENDKRSAPANDKITPLEPDTEASTLGNKISVNPGNEDVLTQVKDNDAEPYINEDDQAH